MSSRQTTSSHSFYLLLHVLVSGYPDGGCDCHGNLPGEVWAHCRDRVQQGADEAQHEHCHVEEAEGQEPGGERHQLLEFCFIEKINLTDSFTTNHMVIEHRCWIVRLLRCCGHSL